jgi:hypothetical protein
MNWRRPDIKPRLAANACGRQRGRRARYLPHCGAWQSQPLDLCTGAPQRAEPGPVQQELNIKPEASYIFSVKNPEASTPPGVGLTPPQKAHYPEGLEQRFHG